MTLRKVLRIGTIILSLFLIIGETVVLLKTDKFWPLSLDDYFIAIVLIIVAYCSNNNKFIPYLTAGWAFVLGNMYAMLFTRLDPIHGSGERVGLLILVNIIALLFLILSIAVSKNMNQKSNTN